MKTKSKKQGFSLPISMVFLLVAVSLSMVLITSAVAATKQVSNRKLYKQAELNVVSSEEVFAGKLLGMSFKEEQVVNADNSTEINVSVIDDNGYEDLADAMSYLIEKAENSDQYVYDSDELTLTEGTSVVKVAIRVYASGSSNYPGDIVLNFKDATADTVGYVLSVRLDGQYAIENGEYSFSEMTAYTGETE